MFQPADKKRVRAPEQTPFQAELIRLISVHMPKLGISSGRAFNALLGKSSNHVYQILNKGMIPSGEAVLDICRVLKRSREKTEQLVLRAIETKGLKRTRDTFWIREVARMVHVREVHLARMRNFLRERGLYEEFLRASGEADAAQTGSAEDASANG